MVYDLHDLGTVPLLASGVLIGTRLPVGVARFLDILLAIEPLYILLILGFGSISKANSKEGVQ